MCRTLSFKKRCTTTGSSSDWFGVVILSTRPGFGELGRRSSRRSKMKTEHCVNDFINKAKILFCWKLVYHRILKILRISFHWDCFFDNTLIIELHHRAIGNYTLIRDSGFSIRHVNWPWSFAFWFEPLEVKLRVELLNLSLAFDLT